MAEELLIADSGYWERERDLFSLKVSPGGSNYAPRDGPVEGFLLDH